MTQNEAWVNHIPESERHVLGFLMLYPERWAVVAEGIGEDDFFLAENRLIFRVMLEMRARKAEIDVTTVYSTLSEMGKVDSITDPLAHRVLNMSNDVVTTEVTRHHAQIVASKGAQRRMERKLVQSIHEIREADHGNVEGVLVDIQRNVSGVASEFSGKREDGLSNADGLSQAFTYASEVAKTGEPDSIDVGLAGIRIERGIMSILAGWPSNGKTIVADTMAVNASKNGHEVVIFNNEDTPKHLVRRRLCSVSSVNYSRMKNGKLEFEQFQRLTSGLATGSHLKITNYDARGKSLDWIFLKAAAHKERHGKLDLVIVDYFQKIKEKGSSRYDSFSNAADRLADFPGDLDCGLVLCSQFSRGDKSEPPRIDYLKETGSLEQNAKLVMLIYYPFIYNQDFGMDHPQDRLRIHTAKNSGGPVGVDRLGCNFAEMRAWDLENKPFGY